MLTLNVPLDQIQAMMLIFLRIMALLMFLPLFESRQVPLGFKAGLAVARRFLLLPRLSLFLPAEPFTPLTFGIGAAGELLIGITLGLAVRLFFAGVQLAGQLAGFQMSLTVANVLDPISNSQISIIAEINNLVDISIQEKDHLTRQFLQWFVTEQLEEVSSMSDLLNVVRRAGETNLLLVEDFLIRNPHTEAAGGGEEE